MSHTRYVICPKCGVKYRYGTRHACKTTVCPICHKRYIVGPTVPAHVCPVVTPPTPPTPPPPVTPPPNSGIFNVVDYGAKTASSDNYPAVQAAINAAVAAGGGTIYFPAGRWALVGGLTIGADVMSANVPLPAGVSIKGDGSAQTILLGNGPSYRSIIGSMAAGVGASGLSVVVPAGERSSTGKDGIKLVSCDGVTLNDVRAENCYISLNVVSCKNIAARHFVSANARDGISVCNQWQLYGTNAILLEDCESFGNNQPGFAIHYQEGTDATRVNNITLRRCYSHGNQSASFYSKWSLNLTLDGCRSDNEGGYGFYLDNAKGYLVSGCTSTAGSGYDFVYINSAPR